MRVRMAMTAKIANPDRGVLSCPVRDLGLGGVYVEADDCLRAGDICTMQISLDAIQDGPRVEAHGRVVRIETGRGTAIEFTGMSSESFDHLDRLVFFNASAAEEDRNLSLDELRKKHPR